MPTACAPSSRISTVVPTVFRPRPARPVRGRRVAYFSTAPAAALPALQRVLAEEHGAEVVLASCDLADRAALADSVARAAKVADVFLTEIKAAAIDVVAEAAEAAGRELVFCDNEPRVVDGGAAASGTVADLDALLTALADTARRASGSVAMADDRELVVVDGVGDAPYSKGLMAQTLMATGLSPMLAHGMAAAIARELESSTDKAPDARPPPSHRPRDARRRGGRRGHRPLPAVAVAAPHGGARS